MNQIFEISRLGVWMRVQPPHERKQYYVCRNHKPFPETKQFIFDKRDKTIKVLCPLCDRAEIDDIPPPNRHDEPYPLDETVKSVNENSGQAYFEWWFANG